MHNYLIVGGTTGIGQALAQQLRQPGRQIFITGRQPAASSPEFETLAFEATRDELMTSALPEVLHGVAYCPGTINLKPFHRITDADFMQDFEVNVLGAIRILRHVLPHLKKADHASVVLFSTVAVQQGMPFHASVAAAKGALEGLTRSLAAEWAPKIRVNAIAPSLTDTPLGARLLTSDEKKKAAGERHPLKRVGEAQEIAELAAFLLTQGSWISGQVLAIDGGMSSLRV